MFIGFLNLMVLIKLMKLILGRYLNKNSWENNTLDLYLNSVGNYTEDIDGFYKNINNSEFDNRFEHIQKSYGNINMEEVFNNIPPIVWRVFADILYSSMNYE